MNKIKNIQSNFPNFRNNFKLYIFTCQISLSSETQYLDVSIGEFKSIVTRKWKKKLDGWNTSYGIYDKTAGIRKILDKSSVSYIRFHVNMLRKKNDWNETYIKYSFLIQYIGVRKKITFCWIVNKKFLKCILLNFLRERFSFNLHFT